MFTYQEHSDTPLETFEWNHVWYEHTEDTETPHVLYIGDSISCNTRTAATAASGGKLLFDGFGTSKALDNPFFKDELVLFARQQKNRRVVLFNNGLHGWHLSEEAYRRYYAEMIEFLRTEFFDVPLLLVLTTAARNDKMQNDRVILRNKIVSELAEQYHLKTIDLYTVSLEQAENDFGDGIHFNQQGYCVLGETVANALKEIYEKEENAT